MTSPRRYKSRTGFTLVELLVAITVLAILAGFIAPAVVAALNRAKEAALLFEMKQIELAIEQFKNDHGFYPPALTNKATMLRYLNKISPQHAENSTSFPSSSGPTRFDDWWTNVGLNLNERTALQFWLSGLCKNKQFPLTGGADATLAAYGVDKYSDGSDFPAGVVIERDNYFEFKSDRLDPEAGGAVAAYEQTMGNRSSGDPEPRDLRYLDYKSYAGNAYHDGQSAFTYFNPKSFQLVTFGRDGLAGGGSDANGINITNGNAATADNLANFTEGKLELYGN